MVAESASDPVGYVRATAPFDALPDALFEEAARALEIGFFPAGSWLVRAGGAPLEHLYVIRRGTVRLERDGQTVQVLEDGETFGYTSLITREATLDAVVEHDLLAYLLPDAEFQRLRRDAAFAGHFAVGLAERLENALAHSPVVTFQPDLAQEIQRLVRRPAVWVRADATVGDAARTMRAERISSVLVSTAPPGIVTDRDFTSRVLAAGLGPETPLAAVASRPLRTFPADAPIHDAWTALLDAGVHHLPLVRGGEIVGVLTDTDLLKSSAQGPMAVLRRVERLAGRESLPGYADKVAEMAAALVAGGLDAIVVGGLVARLNDALVARLLAWAEADLGPPPAPYAWLALGADGRRERTLLTGHDGALVHGGGGEPRPGYWRDLAERVRADLEAAGSPPRPQGRAARRAHGPLAAWVDDLDASVDARKPLAAALLLDFRRAAGALDLAPLDAAVARAGRSAPFLRFLARAAVEHAAPTSLGLRVGAASVDLEVDAIQPVVALARCYGLEVAAPARGTLERLAAARDARLVSAGTYDEISQAVRFLLGLRLRHELRLHAERRPMGPEVLVRELSAIERSRLKDALRAVKGWQERAAYHYRTDFF